MAGRSKSKPAVWLWDCCCLSASSGLPVRQVSQDIFEIGDEDLLVSVFDGGVLLDFPCNVSDISEGHTVTQKVELWMEVAFVPEIWPDTAVGWGSLSIAVVIWLWDQLRFPSLSLWRRRCTGAGNGYSFRCWEVNIDTSAVYNIFVYICVCVGEFLRKALWPYRCLYREWYDDMWRQKATTKAARMADMIRRLHEQG